MAVLLSIRNREGQGSCECKQENGHNDWPWNLIWIRGESHHQGSGDRINGSAVLMESKDGWSIQGPSTSLFAHHRALVFMV